MVPNVPMAIKRKLKQVIIYCLECFHFGIPKLPATECGNCRSKHIRLYREI
jgi:Zn finger protein HypA/HybF involved in hydrogenase expression